MRRVVRESFFELTTTATSETSARPGQGGIGGSEADLLGLPGGLWKQLGGPRGAGKGMVVGVVDSGVTPESASFAAAGTPAPPATRRATARTSSRPPSATAASTPLIGLNPLGVDRITGIAPAAHLAMYKACWGYGVCSSIDVIAAIDSAVADGVDVLNLSLGSGEDTSGGSTPTELALLNADAAGVFVAVSAGNAGEYEGALGSPATAPWTTAVAATTGARTFRTTIEARGARERIAASTSAPGQRARPASAHGVLQRARRRCVRRPALLRRRYDPRARPRRDRHLRAVRPTGLIAETLHDAGATGFVLPIDLAVADDPAVASSIAALYVDGSDLPALRRTAAAGASVSFDGAAATRWQPHRVAWFSSRGPGLASPDLMRPDVAAPGVNVLAAYSPDTYASQFGDEGHEQFNVLSGTSMSSPIVAGTGALLSQLHPGWSPAAIRSALVTTAKPAVDSDGSGAAPHVAAGAGRIDPNAAARPGLVVAP